jgi:hypothetical protein
MAMDIGGDLIASGRAATIDHVAVRLPPACVCRLATGRTQMPMLRRLMLPLSLTG